MDTVKTPCKECGKLVLSSTLQRTGGKCMPCFKKDHPLWLLETLNVKPIPVPTGEEAKRIQSQRLSCFSPELKFVLEAEIAAGNAVVETHEDWPNKGSIFVMLGSPFITTPSQLPGGVTYRDVDDPHYWKAEYVHEPSAHILACRFGRRS